MIDSKITTEDRTTEPCSCGPVDRTVSTDGGQTEETVSRLITADRPLDEPLPDDVVLSALAEEPVDIRTESPAGTVIEIRAVGTDALTVTPEEAVFSLGVEENATPTDGDLSPADLYGAVCPYVKAFPDEDAYRQWANSTEGVTVGIPLSGATGFAPALVA